MGIMQRLNPKAQVMAAAPAHVRDAVGKILEVGDEVVIIAPKCLLRVAEIKPLLDPGAPPHTMMLVLVTRLAIAVPRNQGIEDLYVLRHQAEIPGTPAIPEDEAPPNGDERGPADPPTELVP